MSFRPRNVRFVIDARIFEVSTHHLVFSESTRRRVQPKKQLSKFELNRTQILPNLCAIVNHLLKKDKKLQTIGLS